MSVLVQVVKRSADTKSCVEIYCVYVELFAEDIELLLQPSKCMFHFRSRSIYKQAQEGISQFICSGYEFTSVVIVPESPLLAF